MKSFERIGLDTEKRDFFIGIFVLIAFIVGAYLLIQQAIPKEKSYTKYHTSLTRGYGVGTGSGIMLSDIRIGEVGKINLIKPGNIHIELRVYDEFSHLITRNSKLVIEQAINVRSLLKGPGFSLQQSQDTKLINQGGSIATIERETIATMIEKASNTFHDTINSLDKNQILNNLEKVLVNSNTLVTTLSNIDDTKDVMSKINNILEKIDNSTQEISDMTVSRMDSTTNNINNTSKDIKNTANNLRKLTKELAKIDIDRLNKTVKNIEQGTRSMDFKPILGNVSKVANSLKQLSDSTKNRVDDAYLKLDSAEASLLKRSEKLDTMLDQSNQILLELEKLIKTVNNKGIEVKASYELEEEMHEQ